jgi:hypothetical protein
MTIRRPHRISKRVGWQSGSSTDRTGAGDGPVGPLLVMTLQQIFDQRCCAGFACSGPEPDPFPILRRAVSDPEAEALRKFPASSEGLPAWQLLRMPSQAVLQRSARGPGQAQVAPAWAPVQGPFPGHWQSPGWREAFPRRQAVSLARGKPSLPRGKGATTPSFRPEARRATFVARRRWSAWRSCFAASSQPAAPMLPQNPDSRRFPDPPAPPVNARNVATNAPRRPFEDGLWAPDPSLSAFPHPGERSPPTHSAKCGKSFSAFSAMHWQCLAQLQGHPYRGRVLNGRMMLCETIVKKLKKIPRAV